MIPLVLGLVVQVQEDLTPILIMPIGDRMKLDAAQKQKTLTKLLIPELNRLDRSER